jgi:WD40 repeat protein
MSGTGSPRFLVEQRGDTQELGAFVVGVAFDRSGGVAAFGLGDGSVRLAGLGTGEEWRSVPLHEGAVLALAAHPGGGFASGGDDGGFRRVTVDGEVSDIARFGMRWVEQAVCHSSGVVACSVGKVVHLFDAAGSKLKELGHPSTVTGMAIDGKGKRIAASHYNGASVWFVAARNGSARVLEWKGSHTGIAMHPDAAAVVTAMQENALHGWWLADGKHMRMRGYSAKTQSMSFNRNGKWLATSGADCMVLWPFFGGGPMGKPPSELAGGDGTLCTWVACHPKEDIVAGGFADGLVVIADIESSRILPVVPPGHGKVSALAWSPGGAHLAVGTESGYAAVIDLSKR